MRLSDVVAPVLRWTGRVLAIAGAAFALYCVALLGALGDFDPLAAPSPPLACASIPGLGAPQDAVYDGEAGILYYATFDRRAARAGGAGDGALFALNLRDPAATPQVLTTDLPQGFMPKGLGLYLDPSGPRRLFVANKKQGGDRVDIFVLDGLTATAHETVSDPAFVSLSGVAPVGPRRFYATNDHVRRTLLGRVFESLFRLPDTDIVYFDGVLADPVMKGLTTARGLALSADGGALYVAENFARRIRVLARDGRSGALTEVRRVALPGLPDKVTVRADGHLVVAAPPRLFRLFLHSLDARFAAPSQVLGVDPESGASELLYFNDGRQISAASLGLYGGEALYLGPRYDSVMLRCAGAGPAS